jgi:hypothetical protein
MAGADLGATVRLPTDKNFEPRISNTTTQQQVSPRIPFLHVERDERYDIVALRSCVDSQGTPGKFYQYALPRCTMMISRCSFWHLLYQSL